MKLSREKCAPCRRGAPKLSPDEAAALLGQVPGWSISEADGAVRIERTFKFKDFAGPLAFAVEVGMAAEFQDHHPEIVIGWGSAAVRYWTHAVGGLHRNDFVMAARTDALYRG